MCEIFVLAAIWLILGLFYFFFLNIFRCPVLLGALCSSHNIFFVVVVFDNHAKCCFVDSHSRAISVANPLALLTCILSNLFFSQKQMLQICWLAYFICWPFPFLTIFTQKFNNTHPINTHGFFFSL